MFQRCFTIGAYGYAYVLQFYITLDKNGKFYGLRYCDYSAKGKLKVRDEIKVTNLTSLTYDEPKKFILENIKKGIDKKKK